MRREDPRKAASATESPTSRRRRGITLAVAAFLLPHLIATLAQREFWPFSNYPMYSEARSEWSFSALRLYGVTAEGVEVPLTDPSLIEPYSAYGLDKGLETLASLSDGGMRLHRALDSFLARFEARRQAGQHAGRAMKGLRLYRVRYGLDPKLDPRARDRAPILSRQLQASTEDRS